jgi:hypothetical protein
MFEHVPRAMTNLWGPDCTAGEFKATHNFSHPPSKLLCVQVPGAVQGAEGHAKVAVTILAGLAGSEGGAMCAHLPIGAYGTETEPGGDAGQVSAVEI